MAHILARGFLPCIVFTLLPATGAAQSTPGKYSYAPKAVETGPANEFVVKSVIRPPTDFVGSAAYDIRTNRMWLLAFGPPAKTNGPSMIYQYDPLTGRLLAKARLPFLGELSSAVYLDGLIYVGVPHESKIYKIVVDIPTEFGKIAGSIPVPMLADLKPPRDEPYRLPFVTFFGMTATPEGNLMIHANDMGSFLTLDKNTGKVLKTVPTLRALSGLSSVPGPNGEFLVLANADPEAAALRTEMRRFMFRANHGITPPSLVRSEIACGRIDARDLRWVLLDTQSGNVLASTTQQCTRAVAGSVALMGYERIPGARYGRFRFLSAGEEGVFAVMEWMPGQDAFY